jgi:hypothetical protein
MSAGRELPRFNTSRHCPAALACRRSIPTHRSPSSRPPSLPLIRLTTPTSKLSLRRVRPLMVDDRGHERRLPGGRVRFAANARSDRWQKRHPGSVFRHRATLRASHRSIGPSTPIYRFSDSGPPDGSRAIRHGAQMPPAATGTPAEGSAQATTEAATGLGAPRCVAPG